MTDGNQAEFWDYIDWILLRLAKIGRTKLHGVDETEQFYNAFFNQNDVQVMSSGGDLRRIYRGEIMKKVAWACMPAEGAVAVDVGCGTGDNLRYIYRPNSRLFGLEYAEQTANIARALLGDKAVVQTATATAIPLADAYCDLVLCIEVLEHIPDDEKALSEIARILRPGGSLILSLPYRHWFPSHLKLIGHFRHYTRVDVEQFLSRHGLKVAEYLPNYPRWSRFANYCYVAARLYVLGLRLFGIKRSPVEVKFPFSKERMVDLLFARIEPLRKKEEENDYSKLNTSTFVVATKPLRHND